MKAARTRALNKKHAGTAKHATTAKHTGTATRKSATAAKQKATRTAKQVAAAKARAWTPDGDVALCSARAVAQSLQLALGVPVSHDDVLALYWMVADDADTGASILATLDAVRSVPGFPDDSPLARRIDADPEEGLSRTDLLVPPFVPAPGGPQTLILGLDLPYGEPHAVTVGPDGTWWSWGEPHDPADFPDAVIEEAWAVTWQ